MANTPFAFSPIHAFPPFYTRQPTETTWLNQSVIWSQIILAYCRHHRLFAIHLNDAIDADLFHNKKIRRRLKLETAQSILEEMVKRGDAEWDSPQRLSCTVYWKKPVDWANLIYQWVNDTGQVNSVLTVYELTQGDTTTGQEFNGLDPKIMLKALDILSRQGKAQVFEGSSPTDVGVKFY